MSRSSHNAAVPHRRARRTMPCALVLLSLLAGAMTLGGCGQKGQLYLPHQKKSKVPPTPSNPEPETPGAPAGAPETTPDNTPGSTSPAESAPHA